ncbi:MAG: FixH family protein [Sphingobacteriaceae bacterium]|nr:FixH family protein [Sphingobacteriaceae bacterium]
MKTLTLYAIAITMAMAVISCKKNDQTDPESKTELLKIANGYALGAAAKVELYAKTDLKTGFNEIYVAVFDSISGSRINSGEIALKPIMQMLMNGAAMSHSAPSENPESAQAINGLFPAAAVFTMPSSGESGKWFIEVTVKNNTNNKQGKASIPVSVSDGTEPRVLTVTSLINSEKYIVSYIEPITPKVGVNDFEILINRKTDGMTYPPANNLSVQITPEMPDMGHGSPNNINPVFIKNGHYKGKVNFTMTGLWEINLTLKDETGQLIRNDAFFKVTF